MIDFLRQYWKLIAIGVLVILDLILVILNRRRPVKIYDSVRETVLSILPTLISDAEASYVSGHGKEKLQMVLELVFNVLRQVYGFNDAELHNLEPFIVKNIELILSTPKKKETADE